MIPVILVLVGLFFRVSLPKAIRSGLLVGAGFVGLNLVTGLLTGNIGAAAKLLFERFHLNLKYVDAGWAAAAGIAYSTEVGADHPRDSRGECDFTVFTSDQDREYRYLELLAFRFCGVHGDRSDREHVLRIPGGHRLLCIFPAAGGLHR